MSRVTLKCSNNGIVLWRCELFILLLKIFQLLHWYSRDKACREKVLSTTCRCFAIYLLAAFRCNAKRSERSAGSLIGWLARWFSKIGWCAGEMAGRVEDLRRVFQIFDKVSFHAARKLFCPSQQGQSYKKRPTSSCFSANRRRIQSQDRWFDSQFEVFAYSWFLSPTSPTRRSEQFPKNCFVKCEPKEKNNRNEEAKRLLGSLLLVVINFLLLN